MACCLSRPQVVEEFFEGNVSTPARSGGQVWGSSPILLQPAGGSTYGTGNGIEFDFPLASASSIATGDISGHANGTQDLIIGDVGATPNGKTNAGAVYVVFGGPQMNSWSMSATQSLSDGGPVINGTNGIVFWGPGRACNYNSGMGISVAAGDVNGDGIADLIIAASSTSPNNICGAGSVYVVFGKSTGWVNDITLTSGNAPLDGIHGAEFDGTAINAQTGYSVAAGDLNGASNPKLSDIIMGAPGNTPPEGTMAGSTYVYMGHKQTANNPWPTSPYNLSNLCIGIGC